VLAHLEKMGAAVDEFGVQLEDFQKNSSAAWKMAIHRAEVSKMETNKIVNIFNLMGGGERDAVARKAAKMNVREKNRN
jgi:hypothetical protein